MAAAGGAALGTHSRGFQQLCCFLFSSGGSSRHTAGAGVHGKGAGAARAGAARLSAGFSHCGFPPDSAAVKSFKKTRRLPSAAALLPARGLHFAHILASDEDHRLRGYNISEQA